MNRSFFLLLLVFLIAVSEFLWGRSLASIRNSGVLWVGIREKETIYERPGSNGLIRGFHYQLAKDFGARLGVQVKFKVIHSMVDYFKTDGSGQIPFFKEVDLYADNITITPPRSLQMEFIPLYPNTEVILHADSLRFENLSNLIPLHTSVAAASAYENRISQMGKTLGKNLSAFTVARTADQLEDLLTNRTAYTIFDLDQALFFTRKHKKIRINIDLLQEFAGVSTNAWAVEKGNRSLSAEIAKFFEEIKKNGSFDRTWSQTYTLTSTEFNTVVDAVAKSWASVYRESLGLYLRGDFKGAIDSLRPILRLRKYSIDLSKIETLYDRIFLSSLAQEERGGDPLSVLNNYFESEPSDHIIPVLRRDFPGLLRDYLWKLRGERDEAVHLGDLEVAVERQKVIVLIGPDSWSEQNIFSILDSGAQKAGGIDSNTSAGTALSFGMPVQPSASGTARSIQGEAKNESEIEKLEGESFFKLGVHSFDRCRWEDADNYFGKSLALNFRVVECRDYLRRLATLIQTQVETRNTERKNQFDEHFKKAVNSYLENKFTEALASILKALAIFPENRIAQKYYELISDRLKLEGEKVIDPISPYYSYFNLRMSEVERLIKQTDYQKARTILEEILSLFPHNILAKDRLVFCAYRMNPSEFKKLLDENFAQAGAALAKGDRQEALRLYHLIRELKPDYAGIDQAIAKASPEILTAKKTVPPFAKEGKLNDGLALLRSGKMEDALRIYQEVLRYYPEDYTALIHSARIENDLSTRTAVKPPLAPVDESRRLASENLYLKGKYFFRIHDYDRTLAFWEKARAADPSYTKVQVDLLRLKKLASVQ